MPSGLRCVSNTNGPGAPDEVWVAGEGIHLCDFRDFAMVAVRANIERRSSNRTVMRKLHSECSSFAMR
jgi:hypothetical protein